MRQSGRSVRCVITHHRRRGCCSRRLLRCIVLQVVHYGLAMVSDGTIVMLLLLLWRCIDRWLCLVHWMIVVMIGMMMVVVVVAHPHCIPITSGIIIGHCRSIGHSSSSSSVRVQATCCCEGSVIIIIMLVIVDIKGGRAGHQVVVHGWWLLHLVMGHWYGVDTLLTRRMSRRWKRRVGQQVVVIVVVVVVAKVIASVAAAAASVGHARLGVSRQ